MAVIILTIGLIIGILPIILARMEHVKDGADNHDKKIPGQLIITAAWIINHMPASILDSALFRGNSAAAGDKLYFGRARKRFFKSYQIKKVLYMYVGYLAAIVILLIYCVSATSSEVLDYLIERNEADGSVKYVELDAIIEDVDDTQTLTVTINPRKYSEAELDELIAQVEAYIDEMLPGENDSLEDVTRPLCFIEAYPDENITIQWQSANYNIIGSDGSIGDISDYDLPISTSVTAVITYMDETFYYDKSIIITGKEQSEYESIAALLEEAVSAADDASATALELKLPDILDGKSISWSYHRDNMLPILVFLAICVIFCLAYYQDENLKKQLQERTESLCYSYPGFVRRMVLMLGAGMTVRRSIEQLIKDYEKEGGNDGTDSWLYRELKYAHICMASGVPETSAYISFGRRTELPQYMKFSQLLLQWVRKGSMGMQDMMLQEAYEAEQTRRDLARRRGETAGTKLLLPMVLLLSIVLVMVMAPAFISM